MVGISPIGDAGRPSRLWMPYLGWGDMAVQYMVRAFAPKVAGCGGTDNGWDEVRCKQFEDFLNVHATDGWRLHSSEFRSVVAQGCGGGKGQWLVCTFERNS